MRNIDRTHNDKYRLLWSVACVVALSAIMFSLLPGCCRQNGSLAESWRQRIDDRATVSDWLTILTAAYHEGGPAAFGEAKEAMKRQWGRLRYDPDADDVALILDIGETAVTIKEKELAARVRAAARAIEAAPGRSQDQWEGMNGALLSYRFGNGPVHPYSSTCKVLFLYAEIAGVRPTELF